MDTYSKKKKEIPTLFQEFPSITREKWENKILEDLKGANYEKKLIWNENGIKVRPYYISEDIEKLPNLNQLPGEFPFLRGNKLTDNDWEIRQDIDDNNPFEANKIAKEAILNGAQGIGFKTDNVYDPYHMTRMLEGIDLLKTKVHFTTANSYPLMLKILLLELRNRKYDSYKVKGSFNFDPISYYLLNNDFYNSWRDNCDELFHLIDEMSEELPQFKVINVDGSLFHNCGATIVQELAYSLAVAKEYLSSLIEKGLTPEEVNSKMTFTFALGSNYFMEIAKLRAARILWAKIMEAYQADSTNSCKMHIHAVTSTWNITTYDPWVNMLRVTTEAMSGAIAGVNSMTVNCFDLGYKHSDSFSRRIARNTQAILKEESYFNKVVDPSGGSYYIESLTDSIANEAWNLFLQTESHGGFLSAAQQGIIFSEINKSALERNMKVAIRDLTLLGTNQFPNLNEKMLDKIQDIPEKERDGLKPYRGAKAFEEIRLRTEKFVAEGNKIPSVFLFTIGNLAMRKARASFTTNFFGCAGFQIIDNQGFETVEKGIKKALNSKSEIIVVCSSDDEYAKYGIEITQKIKEKNPKVKIIIAGYPKEIIQELTQAGVDDFIHVRSNILDILNKYINKYQ